jgi:hypothetical protein
VLKRLLEALAGAAQAFVAFVTMLLGLGWGGWTYPVAVVQAMAFVPLLWRARQRHYGLLLLLPVVSAALSVGLFMAGQELGHMGA